MEASPPLHVKWCRRSNKLRRQSRGPGRGGATAPGMYSPGGAEPGCIAPDPKDNAEPIFTALTAELKVLTDNVDRILTMELAAFNAEATRLKLEAVRGR